MKYPKMDWGTMEAVINIIGGMDGVQRLLSGELVVRAVGFLKQIATTVIPGVACFVAADHFRVGTTDGVKIYWLGDSFKQFFLGKVEENVEAANLNAYTLVRPSLDAPILAELGDRAETTLAHLWEMLKKQPRGESGPLLTNGYANIFYVRGVDGNLGAVRACWSGDGWVVSARSVGRPCGWSAGDRVFAR